MSDPPTAVAGPLLRRLAGRRPRGTLPRDMSRTRRPKRTRSLLCRFASSVLSCSLASAAACGSAPDRTQPNIVLIIIDTLRADRLGAYGFPGEISPELDAYARGGVRFDLVVAQNSWTRPSIASMLTSLHPRTLGIYNERGEILGDRFLTLAEALKRHGYTTLGVTARLRSSQAGIPPFRAVRFQRTSGSASQPGRMFLLLMKSSGRSSTQVARRRPRVSGNSAVASTKVTVTSGPRSGNTLNIEARTRSKPSSSRTASAWHAPAKCA